MPHDTEVNPAKAQSEREYEPSAVVRDRHSEGRLARLIEQQTAKLPSDIFLWTAFAAMGLSLFYEWRGRHNASRMVGMWAPTLLTMGVYNKVVKLIGSK